MKKTPFAILLLGLAACASGPGRADYADAQLLVERVVARHAEVVRLTIHAIPRAGDRCRVIASNLEDKLDDWSDPEDIQALETRKPVTLDEGGNLDYTAPVVDATGTAIATVGVTVKGADRDAMLASAQRVAAELSSAILAAGKPLW